MSTLKVYYGWARMNKIRKREGISVIFENCQQNGENLLNACKILYMNASKRMEKPQMPKASPECTQNTVYFRP